MGIDNNESLENLDLEELRQIVHTEAPRVAKLGEWPEYKRSPGALKESMDDRIPTKDDTNAQGFDAGIACALDLIPREKQTVSAKLHGNYTPELVAQVRKEYAKMSPDSETIWWLAACSCCTEGGVDEKKFREQIKKFSNIAADPKQRVSAAKEEYDRFTSTFSTDKYGIPFGTVDGCIQGAYVSGYPVGAVYNEHDGQYYIGTYKESLGLENFPWSDEKNAKGRPRSGPVSSSRQFVKCTNEEEFKRAVEVVKKHLNYQGKEKIEQ